MNNPEQHLESYLAELASRGLAKSTRASYKDSIKALFRYLDENRLPLEGVGYEEADGFVASIAEKGMASSTVTHIISALKGFYSYLMECDLATENPFLDIDLPKRPKRLPKTISEAGVRRLLQSGLPMTDRLIIEILYACGLRVSELAALRVRDIDFNTGYLSVIGKGEKQRHIPMPQRTLDFIRQATADMAPTDHVIQDPDTGKALTRRLVYDRVSKLGREHLQRDISPHVFRHSLATHLMDNGMALHEIQLLLGHASIGTTQLYTSVSKKALMRAHKAAFQKKGDGHAVS